MIVEESVYKGSPILKLMRSEDERYPFSFGLTKAKMIIECINIIKKFVEKNDKPKEN